MTYQLEPGSEATRAKGKWVLWSKTESHLSLEDGHQTRKVIRLGKVAAKRGDLLHTEKHDRVSVWDAWLLPGDCQIQARWPTYDWGAGYFEGLDPDKARALLMASGVELGEGK